MKGRKLSKNSKITQCYYIVRIFLQNRATHFDETFYVALVLPGVVLVPVALLVVAPFKREAAEGRFFLRVTVN